jgi:hypothetical protein
MNIEQFRFNITYSPNASGINYDIRRIIGNWHGGWYFLIAQIRNLQKSSRSFEVPITSPLTFPCTGRKKEGDHDIKSRNVIGPSTRCSHSPLPTPVPFKIR